jgi:transposase
MPEPDAKLEALRQQGTLNPHPDEVTDELFADNPFFDRKDLVQLRRVQAEGNSITAAAGAFGFSRPSFYQAQAAFEQDGLAGLVPRKRGPKQAHKLTDEVLAFLREMRQNDTSIQAGELARLIHQRFGTTVHPRSIQRALLRHQKKRR